MNPILPKIALALQSHVPEVKTDAGYRNMAAYALGEKAKLKAKGNAPAEAKPE